MNKEIITTTGKMIQLNTHQNDMFSSALMSVNDDLLLMKPQKVVSTTFDYPPTTTSSTTTPQRKRKTPTTTTKKTSNNSHINNKMSILDTNFEPSEYDVICARGRQAKQHIGNVNFRARVQESSDEYINAPSKVFKSTIVTRIVDWVRSKSPNGGFVKCVDGQWYEVGDDLARDKVGQVLRELNHSQYKSSMKAKRRRWKKEQQQQQQQVQVQSSSILGVDGNSNTTTTALSKMVKDHYEAVESKWQNLSSSSSSSSAGSSSVSSSSSSLSSDDDDDNDDEKFLNMFTQQNQNLLQYMKSDNTIQDEIIRLTTSAV